MGSLSIKDSQLVLYFMYFYNDKEKKITQQVSLYDYDFGTIRGVPKIKMAASRHLANNSSIV